MLRIRYAVPLLMVLGAASLLAQNAPAADKVLSQAKKQAKAEQKNIFLVFGASWCPGCKQVEAFLEAPEIRPILDKYFVIARLTVAEELGGNPKLNNAGSLELLVQYGGMKGDGENAEVGLPYFVLLDPKGKLIVSTNRPVKGKAQGASIGYPTEPEEIDWFITMLQKAAPGVTEADTKVVRSWLIEHAES